MNIYQSKGGLVVRAVQWTMTTRDEIEMICPDAEFVDTWECVKLRIPLSIHSEEMSELHSVNSYVGIVIVGNHLHGAGTYLIYSQETFERLFTSIDKNI